MKWVAVGAGSMALGIALGAFGAHSLQGRLDFVGVELWKTAQAYQLWNALGLVLVGLLERATGRNLAAVGWLLAAGTVCFSGSLYALALDAPEWTGAVTPLGGLGFIVGWIWLAVALWPKKGESAR